VDVAAFGGTMGTAHGQEWTGAARPHPAHRLHPLRPPPARVGWSVGEGKDPTKLLSYTKPEEQTAAWMRRNRPAA